jgi:pilus assembly protein CpaF
MNLQPKSKVPEIGRATVMAKNMIVTARLPGGRSLKRSFPLGVRVQIGRDEACHVVLPSPAVSRKHAALTFGAEGFIIEDHSSAGTHVDSRTLKREVCTLKKDEIHLKIGPYELEVRPAEQRVQSPDHRRKAHALLLERLRLDTRKIGDNITPELRREVRETLGQIVCEPALGIAAADRQRLARELYDEALGLGPLEALLADRSVSEVMVVDPSTIYAERAGVLELTGRAFTDAEAVRSAIERIVTPLGRRIDESSPLVDARLADGSRVNAVIPPLALRGPCITIRKFPSRRLTMADLVEKGSLTARMARFLERSVALKKNIVISGGTGSGKTTLLNVLSASIGEAERVVTIEDAAELQLSQAHVVGLESKPPNLEGRGEFTIRDLLKNALRMRPDRIVVGECRGGEALDMLQAMNTGHEGSMTTTHANSPTQAVSRLETLCLMSGVELPLSAIRRQISDSIHLIVQQSRLGDGTRRVTDISEVVGLSSGGAVELRSLFRLEPATNEEPASHQATGFMPTYLAELSAAFGHEEGEIL